MDSSLTVIIFIVALIFSVGFLLMVISLVPTINQLKSLLIDLEKTSSEARDLVIKLQDVSEKVDQDIDKVNAILDTSKKTVEVVQSSVSMINKNIFKKSAGLLAFIPAIKLGWNMVKKFKGGSK